MTASLTVKYGTVPFRRWHLTWLEEKGYAAGGVAPVMNDDTLSHLERSGSWTALYDLEPIACGGVVQQWPGRYLGWTCLNRAAAPHMLYLTRAAKRKMGHINGRIEMTVRCDFEPGHRWAEMLGFTIETPILKAYGPEGEDHTSYVRFNPAEGMRHN